MARAVALPMPPVPPVTSTVLLAMGPLWIGSMYVLLACTMLGRRRWLGALGVRIEVGSRYGFPVGGRLAGLEGGDGGVDQGVLMGGVAEVDLGSGDQGTPDRPQGRLGSQPGRGADVGGGQQGMQLLVLSAQARTNGGVVEHCDVGGDQRNDFPVGDQDRQVVTQQLSRGLG
jgi:hypothetical protein